MSLQHAPSSQAVEIVKVRMLPDGRMSRAEAAKYLGVAVNTMRFWETQGTGPESVLVGGRRFHYKEALDAFIAKKAKAA